MHYDDPLMQMRYNFLANVRPEELEQRKRDGTFHQRTDLYVCGQTAEAVNGNSMELVYGSSNAFRRRIMSA